jgi:hypothetical protein
LLGAVPKDIAPKLYERERLQGRVVYTEMKMFNWIKNLKEIDSPALLDEFVLLYLATSSVSLFDRWTKLFGSGLKMDNIWLWQLMTVNSMEL